MNNQSDLRLRIINHKLVQARWVPSPNYNQRPMNQSPSLLVIHNISLPPREYGGPYIEQFFSNQLDTHAHPYFQEIEGLEVSAHLLIRRDGELVQFVAFDQRAWHAGVSQFEGCENCNDFSIGIELEGTDNDEYTDQQYEQLKAVTHCLMMEYTHILPDRIVGHQDIAPLRKTDPGPAFDWLRYKGEL